MSIRETFASYPQACERDTRGPDACFWHRQPRERHAEYADDQACWPCVIRAEAWDEVEVEALAEAAASMPRAWWTPGRVGWGRDGQYPEPHPAPHIVRMASTAAGTPPPA